jgi:hypothetical protein
MLIGCDFCTANGLILDFQRETLSLKQKNQSIEVNFMNRQEEARGGETSFAALRNRQAIALLTPLSDSGQLTRSSKPHSVKPPPCDNEPCDPDTDGLYRGNGNSYFYFKCPPNCAAGVERNYVNTDYSEVVVKSQLNKCYPAADRDKGHVAHKVENEGDVCCQ